MVSANRIKRVARRYNRLNRKQKQKDPMISKKDIRRKKDGIEYAVKMEAAEELGLLDKVKKHGWSGLSAAETGRIGGHMSGHIKRLKKMMALGDDEEA